MTLSPLCKVVQGVVALETLIWTYSWVAGAGLAEVLTPVPLPTTTIAAYDTVMDLSLPKEVQLLVQPVRITTRWEQWGLRGQPT